MESLKQEVTGFAQENGLSGVVRVDECGETRLEEAFGLAHRGYGLPNNINTPFALPAAPKL